MEGFVDAKVRKVVGADDSWETCLVLPIGKGTGEKADYGRPALNEVLMFEKLA